MNISGYTEAFSFVQQDSQTSKWCSYFKHILTGKKRRKSDEEKIFQVVSSRIAFFFWDYWRWDGVFLTWWSAAKEGEGKRKERNGLNYPIYGIIIPETDTQRNMRRAGHGVRLRRCRTVISKAWMD